MDTCEIKRFIKNCGITQRWLSHKLSISPSYLCLILNKDRDKPEWFDHKIKEVLNHKKKELEWQVKRLPKL